jgi:hypothetical protein
MRVALSVAAAGALALPASPPATVVFNACVGGIGLWDSSARVLRSWGTPVRKVRMPPDVRWRYPKGSVLLTRWGYPPTPNKIIVLAITTTDPRHRTAAGIGVGSRPAALLAKHGVRCPVVRGTCETSDGLLRHTLITIANRRVAEITVTLNSGYDEGNLQQPDPRCRRRS